MERWQNKVAVITGASSGIGSACCKYLVARGMIVVGLARRQQRMEELKKSLPAKEQPRFHAYKCDVSKEPEVVQAFAWIEKTLGGVDVLVNNAGIFLHDVMITSENNTDGLKATVETNLLGVAYCAREAFHSMKRRDFNGHIININSILGHGVPHSLAYSRSIYAPTKHAVTAMTEVLRQEFQYHNTKIKVTSISPGAVATDMLDMATLPAGLPLLKDEDIADAVVYCIQTPPNVQIHEMTIKPVGEPF